MNVEHDNTPPAKTSPAKRTGRRYASVAALMQQENVAPEVQEKVRELNAETAITRQLAEIRHHAGLTQDDMARRLACTQSAISKLESGNDDDLTISIIREYVKATNQRVGLVFGRPLNHVEAIKAFAFGIKDRLSSLAALACRDQELEKEIQAFFGEAFFNILSILAECQEGMPNAAPASEFSVSMELFDHRQKSLTRGTPKRMVRRRPASKAMPQEQCV